MITTLTLLLGCAIPLVYDPHAIDEDTIIEKGRIGDILIQVEWSPQSGPIRDATHSTFSHAGFLVDVNDDGILEVAEAVGPVRVIPVANFLEQGDTQIRRLIDYDTNREVIENNLESAADKYMGRPYDFKFGWGDEKIYCSEFVWKAYNDIGIKISPLSTYATLDLTSERVQNLIKSRLEDPNDLKLTDTILTPADLERSPYLTMIE